MRLFFAASDGTKKQSSAAYVRGRCAEIEGAPASLARDVSLKFSVGAKTPERRIVCFPAILTAVKAR